MKSVLLGKTLDELRLVATSLGLPAFTALQLADWLYKKRVDSIDKMTNVSVANREKLKEQYEVGASLPVQLQKSEDGTIKYLFQVQKGHYVESVYIPEQDRATLCVSTQVGCKMNCLFCMTGKQGFSSDLTPAEIVNQILSIPEHNTLTNVVFMGMGEPLDNTEALFNVLEILTSGYGLAWSPKRVTVSTVGIIPGLKRFLKESDCHLAISVHSPYPDKRLLMMPVEKAYPIVDVLDLIRQYDFSHQRRVSFEYILFAGVNDDLRHARDLAKLLNGIPCRVNLIRYHAIPGIALKTADSSAMFVFRDFLTSKGVTCTIRASRGEDILAACGMLSTNKRNNKKYEEQQTS